MDVDNMLKKVQLNAVVKIVKDCMELQSSNESDYTKKQAKVTAFDEIAEILGEKGGNQC